MQDPNEEALIDVLTTKVREWLAHHWGEVIKYAALIAFVLAILVNLSVHHIKM